MTKLFQQVRQKSLAFRAALLGLIVLAAAAVVLPLGNMFFHHEYGFAGGVTAAGICLMAAWLALCVCDRLQGPEYIMPSILVGMMIRMGVPLAAVVISRIFGGPLANADFLNYLIVFYPVTLVAETWLSLPQAIGNGKDDSSAHDFAG